MHDDDDDDDGDNCYEPPLSLFLSLFLSFSIYDSILTSFPSPSSFSPYPPATLGIPWFWSDWGQMTKCSLLSPSPLYQSFSLFLRRRWLEAHGRPSLPDPDSVAGPSVVHVVIECRSINHSKSSLKHSTGRHIRNLRAVIDAVERKIPNIKVTAQDFAQLNMSAQVALSHSAGVFVSMHGAGTTHIFHSAVGKPNCCALLELFPDESIEFMHAQGYGNLAR